MEQNQELLNKFLATIAEEQNFVDYNLAIERMIIDAESCNSTLYNVMLSEGDRVLHLFAKVAAASETLRANSPKIYEIERYVYMNVLKAFDKLQDEYKLSGKDRLDFTKYYGHHATVGEEVLLLENLAMDGYQSYHRFEPMKLQYAESALSELAKLHALSLAYSVHYPEEFKKIMEDINSKWITESRQMRKYFVYAVENAIEFTDKEHKDKVQNYFDQIDKTKFPCFFNSASRRPVLGHGDYRGNNLMHRVQDDGTVDIKIVDLQTMQGSSPVVDLLYFIFTGSDEEFRAQYYEKLLDHYYTELHAAMVRLHLDPEKVYSREDFEYELKEKLPFGLTIAVFTLPVVTVELENAPEVNGDMELSSFSVENTSDLYTERLNGIVNDFIKWGILQ